MNKAARRQPRPVAPSCRCAELIQIGVADSNSLPFEFKYLACVFDSNTGVTGSNTKICLPFESMF